MLKDFLRAIGWLPALTVAEHKRQVWRQFAGRQ
jgi:hypothetical protein